GGRRYRGHPGTHPARGGTLAAGGLAQPDQARRRPDTQARPSRRRGGRPDRYPGPSAARRFQARQVLAGFIPVNGSDQAKLADLARLRRARDQMDREYAQPLDLAKLARTALMSPGHFSRSFRAAYGQTPHRYLMTRRIERAKALLRRGDLSVTEVGYSVGFSSL